MESCKSKLEDELEIDLSLSSDDPELRKVKTLASIAKEQPMKFDLERLEYCSKWPWAKMVSAMCLKLKKKLQKQVSETNNVTHVDDVEHQSVFDSQPLTVDNLNDPI